MKRTYFVLAIIILLTSWALAGASAGKHGATKPDKKGILLVAFGTSIPEAQKAFTQIEKQVKEAFPGVDTRWAFTSKIIRAKLRKQGKDLDPPITALAKMMEDGFTQVLVASFHTISGEEFHDLHRNAHLFDRMRDGIKRIIVSRPLLSSREDYERVIKALMSEIPKSRKPDEALLFMGHGSEHHPADDAYAAMNFWLAGTDPNAYVGTVAGQPTLDDFLPKLKKKGVKKAYLMPFMSVAGDHARNDMCGDESDSWKSILKREGMQVECILKGTAEIPGVVDVWIDHMKSAFSHFK
jgi:sirohydrochlorin cobaltochelatase